MRPYIILRKKNSVKFSGGLLRGFKALGRTEGIE